MMKKLIKWLTLWDGVWSVPLALLLFIAFGFAGEWIWGPDFGSMSPAFFHSAVFAALVIIALNTSAWLGIWFNFRGVYRYYLHDSANDFKTLTAWQKICFIFALYALYFVGGLLIVIHLV